MSVLFDQLRISDNGRKMYINLHVNRASYFENIFLDSLTIMTADRVSETNPSEPTRDYIYKKVFDGNQKEADLVLDASDFIKTWEEDPKAMRFPGEEMSHTLFFVYVKVKGAPGECTPCTMDEQITVGVTFDVHLLYQRVMGYTKGLADTCQVPAGFMDFILLWNAFKAAIETDHYIPAIKYYNMLFGHYDLRYTRDGSHSPFGGAVPGKEKPSKPCNCR